MVGKFTWGNKAKHCWVMSTNVLFSKFVDNAQAIFCPYTPRAKFPAHNLNFPWKRRWCHWIQATVSDIFYFMCYWVEWSLNRGGILSTLKIFFVALQPITDSRCYASSPIDCMSCLLLRLFFSFLQKFVQCHQLISKLLYKE